MTGICGWQNFVQTRKTALAWNCVIWLSPVFTVSWLAESERGCLLWRKAHKHKVWACLPCETRQAQRSNFSLIHLTTCWRKQGTSPVIFYAVSTPSIMVSTFCPPHATQASLLVDNLPDVGKDCLSTFQFDLSFLKSQEKHFYHVKSACGDTTDCCSWLTSCNAAKCLDKLQNDDHDFVVWDMC